MENEFRVDYEWGESLTSFEWDDADFWTCAHALTDTLTTDQLLMLANMLLYVLTDERHPDEMIHLFESMDEALYKRL